MRIDEIPVGGDAVIRDDGIGVVAADLADLLDRPAVELPLDAFGVGVLRGVPAVQGIAHVAQQETDDVFHDAPVARVARHEIAVQIRTSEQGVVVQHLLEVRHEPEVVGRVTREPATELIVNAARGHRVERRRDHRARLVGVVAEVRTAQEVDRHCLREFRCATEPAVARLELRSDRGVRAIEDAGIELVVAARVAPQHVFGQRVGELLALRRYFVSPVAPSLRHRFAHAPERRHAVAIGVGEVRARIERTTFRRAPDAHWPSAPPGQCLHRLHVDRVDVGAFLAVDLHVHEARVHQIRSGIVLERLVCHHVTPMARRIADRQEHGHVPRAGERERLVAPRHPLDGIVGVLAEVRARLARQPILRHASTVPGVRVATARAHR